MPCHGKDRTKVFVESRAERGSQQTLCTSRACQAPYRADLVYTIAPINPADRLVWISGLLSTPSSVFNPVEKRFVDCCWEEVPSTGIDPIVEVPVVAWVETGVHGVPVQVSLLVEGILAIAPSGEGLEVRESEASRLTRAAISSIPKNSSLER